MTTLSWDGRTLAANTRISYVQLEPTAGGLGTQIKIPVTKIFHNLVHSIQFKSIKGA